MKSAAVLFAASFALYLYTLAPVVTFVDSGELAAVVGTSGVSHPSGSPFYLLLASVVKAIPIRTLIWRLNAFSAACAALSVGVTYLTWANAPQNPSRLETSIKKKGKNVPPTKQSSATAQMILWVGGITASLTWMSNQALWKTATVTEVYALHALLISALFFFLFLYLKTENIIFLALASLMGGFGIANYPPFGIVAPAALFLLFHSRRWNFLQWKPLLTALGSFAIGLLPYILLPLRAKSDPLLNWGNPQNWDSFWKHVTAQQYRIFLGSPDLTLLDDALSLWFQQWPLLLFVFVPFGLFAFWKKSRQVLYFSLILGILNLVYVLTYDITDVSSAPSDYYVYLLPLSWATALWIGAGIASAAFLLSKKISRLSFLFVLIPLIGIAGNWKESNLRNYTYADDFARGVLQSLPEKSLVLTSDWTFVSPAMYLQHIENIRPDVVVFDVELLRRSWYFPYVKKRAPWLYECCQQSIDAFLQELSKYESGQPYDGNIITAKFVGMLNHFLNAAQRWNYSPHILLNLQAKELDPQGFRRLEETIGRPPFITTGVAPQSIGFGFQWVPETLAFRLYKENLPVALPDVRIPPRPIDRDRSYDQVTLGVFARYAEFWRWRGDYFRKKGLCKDATGAYQKALSLDPSLPEAIGGLSECS